MNQAVVQADRVNIKRGNVGNGGRIARRAYNTQEESAKSINVQKETRNVQRTLRTSSPGTATNDSKYFVEQMLHAKKDEAEHNDFLLANVDQMKEIEELSANICMMARIQQATIDSDEGPSYYSRFISEKCSDQHDNELELLARNAYREVEKQLILAKKFPEEVKVMMDVFDSMESKLDATLRQNEILTERLLEATLIHDIEKCVLMCSGSMNDELHAEIEKVKRDSIDV
ncbi:hypothetical protein Tco_0970392 [Tanacetum coccineum]